MAKTALSDLVPGVVVEGPIVPEPIEIMGTTVPMGGALKLIGRGLRTNQVHQPVLDGCQVAQLTSPPRTTLRRRPRSLPPGRRGAAPRPGLRVRPLLLALHRPRRSAAAPARGRLRLLPEAAAHPLPAGRRPRRRQDDHGGLLLKELKIRGLVKRTLIVTPANLSFQWQREMKDKFRENFEVIRGDVLRANYGSNPWQEKNQVITSVSWVSRIEDAKESLLRSQWDLIIVDEAHKMSASSADKKTLAYQLGEALSEMTDHYLLMTATPHKGDPENFCLFLQLLDRDVYGDVEEPRRGHAAQRGAVLPAPRQGSPGHLPRPRHRQVKNALHQARRADHRVRRSTTTSGTSTTP